MQTTDTIHVLVLHEEPIVAAGLAAVLGRDSRFSVALPPSAVDIPRSAIDFSSQVRVDVVVADYQSGLNYLTHARAAARQRNASTPKVLVITQQSREWEVRFAMNAGVHGYVLQGCDLEELVLGVRMLSMGSRYLCETVTQRIAESLTRVTLTAREQEVLELLTKGYCNKTIAKDLAIAVGTVKAHVKRVLEKLDATTRTQAVVVATHRGLVAASQVPPELRRPMPVDEPVMGIAFSAARDSTTGRWAPLGMAA